MTGIISSGAGNLFSLQCSLDRIGEPYEIITNTEQFSGYDRYIIPGVGHAGAAMEKLRGTGLVPLIKQTAKPVLGICVGMQLLTAFSEEGDAELMNIIPVKTIRFKENGSLKIPHTGWNKVYVEKDNALYHNISDETQFYFVHSFHTELNANFTVSSTIYGERFSSAVGHNHFYGVQFHPEKSGNAGETLLRNFINI